MLGFTKDGEEGQLYGCLCGKRGELCSPGNLGAKDFAYAYLHTFVCLPKCNTYSAVKMHHLVFLSRAKVLCGIFVVV